ncbi:MAG TPA: hypothetical protein VGG72_02235 [Bryobacteraceae bacterium]|jgi:hypothetical protein
MLPTKSSLSMAQKRLLEIMQKTNFGRIQGLMVRDGQPVFDPPPRIVKDVKLGAADSEARAELEVADFALKREHIELFENLRRMGDGTVESIEIKSGLPFRITLEQRV